MRRSLTGGEEVHLRLGSRPERIHRALSETLITSFGGVWTSFELRDHLFLFSVGE